jgi:hypothetical protein
MRQRDWTVTQCECDMRQRDWTKTCVNVIWDRETEL